MSNDPARHILKTHPMAFTALLEGRKAFEFRKDDRGFEVGDMLVLKKWTEGNNLELCDSLIRWVTYILRAPDFGVPEGYCVMSVSGRMPRR